MTLDEEHVTKVLKEIVMELGARRGFLPRDETIQPLIDDLQAEIANIESRAERRMYAEAQAGMAAWARSAWAAAQRRGA